MRVLVVGGSGALGRRLLALCARHAPELACTPASRAGDGGLSLDLHDSRALQEALADFDVLVNAVGPYDYEPDPVVRACVEARCHYIDLAELPEFLTAVARAAQRAGAEDADTLVVPGCSTSPSLIACLAQRFRGLAGLARVDAWLSIGTDNPSSPALLYGLLRPLGCELPDGERAYARVARRSARDGTALCYGRYPFPRDNEALDLGAGALPVRFFAGFDRSFVAYLLCVASRVLHPLSDATLRRWTRWGDRAAKLARPFGGRIGRLALEAFDGSGACLAGIEVTAEREGLDVPAAPAMWLLQNIALGPVADGGCIPFERRIDADAALAGLAGLGCRVDTWQRAR